MAPSSRISGIRNRDRHSGAMRSIEPGISRFRVWSFGPSRNDELNNKEQKMSVRIVDVCEVTKPISSPIRNAYIDFTKMTTSLVAVVTDARRDGKRVVGYGFNSNGRYGQGGLIRERFAPRLMEADPGSLLNEAGDNLDRSEERRVGKE